MESFQIIKKTFWWGDGCRWLTNKVYPILYIIMMRRRASWPKLMAFLTLHALYSCPHFGKTHVTFFSKMIFLIINIILIACEKKVSNIVCPFAIATNYHHLLRKTLVFATYTSKTNCSLRFVSVPTYVEILIDFDTFWWIVKGWVNRTTCSDEV